MVNDLKGGTFGTKHYEIGLSDNSVRLLKTPHIPDNLWSEMMGLRDQIISGGVEVDMITDAQAVRKLMTSVDINEG